MNKWSLRADEVTFAEGASASSVSRIDRAGSARISVRPFGADDTQQGVVFLVAVAATAQVGHDQGAERVWVVVRRGQFNELVQLLQTLVARQLLLVGARHHDRQLRQSTAHARLRLARRWATEQTASHKLEPSGQRQLTQFQSHPLSL